MYSKITKIISIIIIGCFISGCELPNQSLLGKYSSQKNSENIAPELLWARMKNNFQLDSQNSYNNQTKNKRVDFFVNRYSSQAYHFDKLSNHASRFLYHVVEELESRNMPGELAILPMVESAYKPHVTSTKGASGLWQIGSSTGKRFGLTQDYWYDGRKDVPAATQAALDYLAFLHKEFKQDWLLAIAAYNSGEGRIKRAIEYNKQLGKPTDFWSLKLPKQTQDFVPKLLAIAHLIQEPEKFGIKLNPIENKPYFTSVQTNSPINLNTAAKLAEMDIKELRQLNPAYKTHTTHPNGPHKILLPISQVTTFEANLEKIDLLAAITISQPQAYKIQHGDSLSLIAKLHKTTVTDLKSVNQLNSDRIVTGQKIIVPNT